MQSFESRNCIIHFQKHSDFTYERPQVFSAKMNYVVRFDEKLRDRLQTILNIDLQEGTCTQASLPVSV